MTKVKATVKAVEVNKASYPTVNPKLIVVNEEENPRQDYGNIEELMKSILENGIKSPLAVYEKDGKYILKHGFRRMRAITLALQKGHKIDRVPIQLEQSKLNQEERTLEHIVYNDGKPLTMLEQSEVIRRLLNFEWKVGEIVKRTGKARGYIDNLILLTKVPKKIENYIKADKISAHTVIQIMQAVKGDDEKAISEVEAAIQNAKESGKEKATPKHVGTKEVKNNSFGKFYKWVEEIANTLAGRKDVFKERQELLEKLLQQFENNRPASEMISLYFLDHSKAKTTAHDTKPTKPAPVSKVAVKKSAKAKPTKKVTGKAKK